METKRISLALQGGGAHGAFTWGVLERLLEEPWLEVAAVSGTSAGALNAAALKSGWAVGGSAGARAALRMLWTRVAGVRDLRMMGWYRSVLPPVSAFAAAAEAWMPVSPADWATRVFSPYDYGPFWRNPLAPVVEAFNLDEVCADAGPRLVVAATNVRTGKVKVFEGAEISHAAILASAALPTLFRAVEIDGEAYWDGGYASNPALFPLYDKDLPDDIVIVSINPLRRDEVPTTAPAIVNRINEISFNAALLRDLRAIAFVKRLIAEGRMEKGAMKDVLVHLIADDALMTSLSVRTKVTPTPLLIDTLHAAGRKAADRFLTRHAGDLGVRSSCDLVAMFN
jgi:NTE family protein